MNRASSAALLAAAALYLLLLAFAALRRRGFENRAVLTGGGSSGHIYPAVAVASALEPEVSRFLYLGTRGRVEEKVVPREGIPIKFISSAPYPSSYSGFPAFLARLSWGTLASSFHLFEFQPRFVIGTGGFVSAPVVFAAFFLKALFLCRAKIYLQEQNASPGKLNLLAARIASRVMVTFPGSLHFFRGKGIFIGYPVRKAIKALESSRGLADTGFHIPAGRKVVFAFGGSQGSRTINRAVVDALRHLLPLRDEIFVVLGAGLGQSGYCGPEDVKERLAETYTAEEISAMKDFFYFDSYFYDISSIFSRSSLVVARSGAGALFELSQAGLPSILVPKLGLSGEHQVMNAMAMEKVGGGVILFERPSMTDPGETGLGGDELAAEITRLLGSPDDLRRMRENAVKLLPPCDTYGLIRSIVLGKGPIPEEGAPETPFRPLKSSLRVMEQINIFKEKRGPGADLSGLFTKSEMAFYKTKAMKLLMSRQWQPRNLGVKLCRSLKISEAGGRLMELALSREKAPLWERAFGGDFREVGFIRRNAVAAFMDIELDSRDLERLLKEGLSDPYYEVQAAALALARANAERLSGSGLLERARELLRAREFEVAKEAVLLVGEMGGEGDLDALLSFREHFFWQIREAALAAIRRLVERGIPCDRRELKNALSGFVLTSTDFRPNFVIKESYRKLFEALEKGS